jgi:competence protein ComEC
MGIACRAHFALLTALTIGSYMAFLVVYRLHPRIRVVLKRCEIAVLAPFLFSLGMLLGVNASKDLKIDLCLSQTKAGKTDGTVTGKVFDIGRSSSGFKIELRDAVIFAEGLEFREGAVLCYFDTADGIDIGNTVTVKGTLREFSKAENPGQFDEIGYYRAKGFACKLYVSSFAVTDARKKPLKNMLGRLRERLSAVYDAVLPEEEAGLVKALVLGDKSTLDDDTRDLYRRNGIAHILAISGLHISLVAAGLYALLRALKVPLKPAAAVTFGIVFCYGMLTGFSVSTVRAVFMTGVRMLAQILGHSYDSGEACALCGLGLLFIHPLMLFGASFVLSFAAAIGIGYFTREFAKWEKTSEKTRSAAALGAVLSTLAPQLSTVPFIWYFYYEIPVYSILANMIILPGMSLLVALSSITGVTGLVFLSVSRFFAGGVFFLLKAYKFVCTVMLKLPNPILLYGKPERIRMVICYALIILFFAAAALIGKKYGNGEISAKKRPYAALILLLIPLVFIKFPQNGIKISFLSVGQGDCCVIKVSNRSAVIVDCGSSSAQNIVRYRLEPFLKYSGIDTIETVFLTHPDKDHFSGIEELLREITNDRTYRGTVRVKRFAVTPNTLKNEKIAGILDIAAEKGVDVFTFLAGDKLKAGNLSLLCLSPDASTDTADNAGSIVLAARYGEFTALLMGDSGATAEQAVINACKSGLVSTPVNILKVAHHGSRYSTSEHFLESLQPVAAVVSFGKGNVYNHPHKELLQRLEAVSAVIYKTGASGAAVFRVR